MKTKTLFLILVSLLIHGCNSAHKPYAIFEYEDFGPQSMIWKKIGMQWWQWDDHGDSDPRTRYDIKVVVYADRPLDEIKTLFPVDKNLKNDYRYFEYHEALKHLDENIREMNQVDEQWAVDLEDRLIRTRERILREIDTGN